MLSYRKNRTLKLRKRLASLLLGILLMLALFIVVSLVSFFFSGKKLLSECWNRQDQFNLALVSSRGLLLVATSPRQKTSFLVFLPFASKFIGPTADKVKFVDYLRLFSTEENDYKKMIEYGLGFPLDFVFYKPGMDTGVFERRESGLGDSYFPALKKELVKISLKEKMDIHDRLNLAFLFFRLSARESLIKQRLDPEKEGILYRTEDELVFNPKNWNEWADLYFADVEVKAERANLGLRLAPEKKKAWQTWEKILTNSGFFIGNIDYAQREERDSCRLVLKQEELSFTRTFKRLKQLFPECKTEISDLGKAKPAADLVLYLNNFVDLPTLD